MRPIRALAVLFVLSLVIGLCTTSGRAQVPGSVIVGTGGTSFYGIGDFGAGGTNSIVQEATQVGSTVYAVGASTQTATNTPFPNLDTAVVWDSASNALTVVPDLVTFLDPPSGLGQPTGTNSVIYAITPDATYIGGRLRNDAANSNTSNGIRALRVLGGLKTIPGFTALDVSDDGNILFGQQSGGAGNLFGVNNSRAIRSDVSGASTITVQVPLLTPAAITAGGPCATSAPTCLDNLPAYRGMSADGSVLVGTAFTGSFTGLQNQYATTNGLAFRWVFGAAAVTEIPRPDGGTWSSAIAISPNGNLTLVGGNSSQYPLGEVWLYDATVAAPTSPITELGSPNTQFSPRLYGGMTADGSVVGVTFMGANPAQSPTFQSNPVQYAYLHNSHGWFHLANVLADQGVDLWGTAANPGWDPANMILTGIRTVDTDNNGTPDVDLVFGQGRRRNANGSAGAPEGFVASFPVGVLAAYQLPAPAPVANTALVGAWALGSDPNNPLSVMVLLADGTYYTTMSRNRALAAGYGTGRGNFERGVYTLTAGNGITFTSTEDRDGAGPHQSGTTPATFVFNGLVSSLNGRQSLSVNFTSADTFTVEDATCSPVCSVFQGTRIAGAAGSIAGAWTANNPPFFPFGRFIIVFLNSNAGFGQYQIADGELENQNDGDEGTYVWDANLHQFTLIPLSGSPDIVNASLTSDELGLVVDDPGGDFTLTRIVNPSTVLPSITNPTLGADGTQGSAFSYTVTGTNTVAFGATNLPPGLAIDENTGEITGTPTAKGTFTVTISATNTLGSVDAETLVLTFAGPTTFAGIGDLPGGAAGSAVRDATRVNGTLYAVGSSVARDQNICTSTNPNLPAGCLVFPNLESPAWWQGTASGAGTLAALPEAVVHDTTPPTNQIFAYAITPHAEYIAGQAHFTANSTGTQWVRDTNTGGTVSIFTQGLSTNIPQVAYAMSDDGATVYGTRNAISARVDIVGTGAPGTTATITTPLALPAGTTVSQPVARGTTATGAVMVGVASNGSLGATNGVAFQYTKATNSTAVIPLLAGGSWNYPVAISSSGAQTVVAGNSAAFPSGEVYLTDANNTIIATLGSPNTGLAPKMLGGITADGVVAVTFGNGGNNPSVIQTGGRYAYIHNDHGWFHFSSVLAAQGVDLVGQGWDPSNMAITGVRTVEGVDLVFGQGMRRAVNATGTGYVNVAQEGFVAELPAGALAAFNPTPTPPADQSLVGTWLVGVDPTNPSSVVSFRADGTYVRINVNATTPALSGFERGLYTWAGNDAGGAVVLTTLYDTDGTAGTSGRNGQLGNVQTVDGDILAFADTHLYGITSPALTPRLTTSPGSIVGGWVAGNAALPDNVAMAVFLGSGAGLKYYFASDDPGGDYFGTEMGTYTWDPLTHAFVATRIDGTPDPDTTTATLSRDELGLELFITEPDNDAYTVNLTRVVAPGTVLPVITPATLNAGGSVGTAFSHTVTAANAVSFSAAGLPPGLSIDETTGVISGTPAAKGVFNVTVTATNSLGGIDVETLVLAFSGPTTFFGIGDLPPNPGGAAGAVASGVRDATRVNGVIYAVGASAVNNTNGNQLDTPVLWDSAGGAPGTLQALPHALLPPNTTDFVSTQTDQLAAYAITPDAVYIASQAKRTDTPGAPWVRVTRSLLPSTTANLDINLSTPSGVTGFAALSISDSGTALYGQGTLADTTRRAIRYETGVGANYPPLPAGSPAGTWSVPIPRGTSSDGLIMIGFASSGNYLGSSTPGSPFGYPVHATNTTAFRYVHNAGTLTGTTTAIDKRSTAPAAWNFPIAMSTDGAVTVVAGNSDAYPNGEIYLTDAANAVTTTLGSPNTGMTPRMMGGRTGDGAIVVTFANDSVSQTGLIGGLGIPPGGRLPYLHNDNGWFPLGSVLRQQGLDLEALGWSPNDMAVTGVRTIEGVDLVFGQARRRTFDPNTGTATATSQEGFVIELPAGELAGFNPPTTPIADDSLIGGWILGAAASPSGIAVFLSDGRYVSLTQGSSPYQRGSERGSFTWAGNASEWRVTTRVDANATFGLQGFSSVGGRTLTVTGDTHTIYNTHCNPGVAACEITVPRVVGTSDSIVGTWHGTIADGQFAGIDVTAVFLGAAQGFRYFVDYDMPGTDEDEYDVGTYTYDAVTHTLTTTSDAGNGPDPADAVLSRDGLSLTVTDDGVTIPLARVVVPASVTPVITVPPSVGGPIDVPFNYQIDAIWAQTFSATDLPAGLSIDANTGVVSGTPTGFGLFDAVVHAANSFGREADAVLHFVITAVPVINSSLTVSTPIDVPFSYTIAGTHSPTTFNATGLPAGLSVNTATGEISGTPTEFGVFTVGLTAANIVSEGSATLNLTVTAVPVFTSPLFVPTPAGGAFTYTITATHSPTTFTAGPLPSWLTFNASTGVLSGTAPQDPGAIAVTITAANSVSTGMGTLNVSVTGVAPTGTGDGILVAPPVPPDTPPVTLEFSSVTGPGDTTVALVAPEVVETIGDIPSTFVQVEVGGQSLVYQIETTAAVAGPVDICFVYPPEAFQNETPRLLHFDTHALPEPGQWIDVTSSVDELNSLICGTVESFSPFVVVKTETPFLGTSEVTLTFEPGEVEPGKYLYRGTPFIATAVVKSSDNVIDEPVEVKYSGDCTTVTVDGCRATATFQGRDGYSGHTASKTIFILPIPASVTTANGGKVYGTPDPTPLTSATLSGFLPADGISIASFSRASGENAGGYHITTTLADPDGRLVNYVVANAGSTFMIARADATVILSDMTQAFTGSALTPTVTTVPAGLNYTLSGAPQTGPGSFQVTATIQEQNYAGSATGTFVITAPSVPVAVELLSPNGLEQRFIGVPTTIRWAAAGASSIDVALSRDGGQSYTAIPGCTALAGTVMSCVWTPTGPATLRARVKVTARSAVNTTASDASAMPFLISSGSPSVKVQLPTGLAAWAVGTTKLIAWTHNLGANATFRIELSRNNGGSWETLSASADGALLVLGGFPWKVTEPTTANAKIRITSLDSPASSVSSSFAIANPSVTVTAPNTNVSWSRSSQKTITWTHNLGLATSMKIEISRDGGGTWTTLAASVTHSGATSGSYNWTVTGPTTSMARIRVSWTTDATVKDMSDVNFRIK